MILADKIMRLRKKNGWSQEELAEKMQVSRQAVSKWEGAQAVPDLEKILKLSGLFGVTTDYLLKDELEEEEDTGESGAPVKQVTLAQANEFLSWRKSASVRIAAATLLCIVAVIPLLVLGALTQYGGFHLSENLAAGAGLITLLVLVAAAVAIFIFCGFKNAPFDFKRTYAICNITGTCICVLSPIPLFIGVFTQKEYFIAILLALTILLAGIGTMFFIVAGVRWASMQKLLKEGEFALREKRRSQIKETVSTAYWLTAAAVYLGWSFWSDAWKTTWIVWPVAGVLFAAVMCLCNLLIDREK